MIRAAVALCAAAALAGCRFERRPDAPGTGITVELPVSPGAADSARALIGAMTTALEARDPGRVRDLTAPGAILLDQDEGVRWTRADSMGALPPALPVSTGGLGWRLEDSSYSPIAPDAALFSLRYVAHLSVDTIPRTAVESWVTVRTGAGWRVQYLHRSRGLAPNPPRR